ncbi:homogentisate phytyltransferase 1, chloroplastic [Cajanus cajan]|nr:homogentisate phytyltransferase 1, chloroplastic [Cajanus cajan]XP_029130498.1 homogentisate phytyltransferase 1, chloroplastic [Cajanus cajan]XP_029130499.1 homogentisate phytyltransferase 1, chloroplastic [Cajanus cajan]
MASMPLGSLASSFTAGSHLTKASWNKTKKIRNEYPIVRYQQQHNLKHHYKCIELGSTYKERARSNAVNAIVGESFESKPQDYSPKSIWGSVKDNLDAFYRFTRPHTIIGTALSIISVSLLAVQKLSDISPTFFIGLIQAITATIFMNIYVVGLNQLTDVEIDKINKPFLPLASGEFSFTTGVIIVALFLIKSFGVGWIAGSWPLLWALIITFLIGTGYSIDLPLLRWKRFAVLAAMSIVVVRTIIVQFAFFLHMQMHVFKRPIIFPKSLILATTLMGFFSSVIALFKDIPDIKGDQIFDIKSFSVRFGKKRMFWICVSLLEMAYGIAVMAGATSSNLWSKMITVMC